MVREDKIIKYYKELKVLFLYNILIIYDILNLRQIMEGSKILRVLLKLSGEAFARDNGMGIDFDKMLHRNEKTLIYASSLKVPSFGQYNPKYKWIDKDKNIISFNPDEKDEKRHKKYLIKKICTSYNVNSEYQIVDNTKLK